MKVKRLYFFLIPFSLIYFLIIFLRNIFYNLHIFRIYRINAKVISIGNITWGGTGKTPVSAFIAELLLKKNHKIAILIRGYGRDENKLLSNLVSNVPILVGKDRVRTAKEAVEKCFVDTVLLDDGFQYSRLKRDLDIVCVDATNPFGNEWMIPAGSMRENLGALKRADIFLITKTDLVKDKARIENLENRLKRINPNAIIAKTIHRPLYFYKILCGERVNIDELKNKKIALLSGIASPYSFEKTILRLGLKVNKHFIFRDHHWYSEKDLEQVADYCTKNDIGALITTEKDAVRLSSIEHPASSIKMLVLRIKLEIIDNEQGFYNRLFGIYNS